MPAYQNLELTVLIEMLSEHTRNYTKMMAEGFEKEADFKNCQLMIQQLQTEIGSRNPNQGKTTFSDTNMSLKE